MATFLLIHGTFARNAEWTRENSPLRTSIANALAQQQEHATFVPIAWSGRNRGADRQKAAESIATEVTSIHTRTPDERVFLIGHSHGGSAIAYFLKNFSAVRPLVAGAIFLSTPFIALRAKGELDYRVGLIFWIASFGIYFLLFNAIRFCLQEIADSASGYYALLALNIAFGVAFVTVYRSFKILDGHVRRVRNKVKKTVDSQDTCNLPIGRYLFIRFSGDEAAMSLSFAQFVMYALNTVVELFYSKSTAVLQRVSNTRWIGRDMPEIALLSILGAWLLLSPMTIDSRSIHEITKTAQHLHLEEKQTLLRELDKLEDEFVRRHEALEPGRLENSPYLELIARVDIRRKTIENEVDPWPIYKLYLHEGLVLFASTLLNVLAAVAIFIAMLFAGLRAFGATELTQVLYTDLSVEILPYGESEVINLDWRPVSGGLMHSQAYESDHSLQRLTDWIVG